MRLPSTHLRRGALGVCVVLLLPGCSALAHRVDVRTTQPITPGAAAPPPAEVGLSGSAAATTAPETTTTATPTTVVEVETLPPAPIIWEGDDLVVPVDVNEGQSAFCTTAYSATFAGRDIDRSSTSPDLTALARNLDEFATWILKLADYPQHNFRSELEAVADDTRATAAVIAAAPTAAESRQAFAAFIKRANRSIIPFLRAANDACD